VNNTGLKSLFHD